MNRKIHIVLIIVGIIILVLVVAPFLIPVNQFRPTIEERASAALGRKVTVGNLSLSLLSGSLSAEDLSIGDDPKFSASPFLTAKSVKVGVEMIPLIFSKTLNVTGVNIENPQVTLLRNTEGRWNYSSLGGSQEQAGTKAETKEEPKPPAPKNAPPVATPSNSPNSSSSSASLSIQKLELTDGQINIGATNLPKRTSYEHVNVSASGVSLTSKFPVSVTADLPGGGKFKFEGLVGPIDQADASLTPLDAKLNVSSLNLASTGLLDPSLGLGGLLDLDATLGAQNGEAETKGTAKLSKALLVAGGSPAVVPVTVDFDTKYDLRKSAGVLNPSTLKIGNATARLDGTYESKGEATVINIKLDAQNMPAKDLESFLPALGIHLPKGATLQAGTLSANLNLTGPTNKLLTTGNVGLYNGKLANFDLGSRMSTIASLAGIQTGKDLLIEKLTSNLRMAPDGLRADKFLAVIPSLGTLIGGGTIDAKNNLDFKMAATLTNALGAAGSPVSDATAILARFMGGGSGGGGSSSACKKGTTVPFMIQGTTSDPKFVPDVGGIAEGMIRSQLGCAGGVASGATQGQNPADVLSNVMGMFGKKKKP